MTAKEHTYKAAWSDEEQDFIGTCPAYPSLSWIAETEEEALTGIYELVQEVEEDVKNDN